MTTPSKENPVITIHGDCRHLHQIPDERVQTIVTSPPYWNLRSYLAPEDPFKKYEIGSEPTLEQFLENIVAAFRECKRILRRDGSLWVNFGDAYAATKSRDVGTEPGTKYDRENTLGNRNDQSCEPPPGYKAKDLLCIPWRVALALQADGWYLRAGIPWIKRNVMPESCEDRPTTATEYVFLFSKTADYYFDMEAIRVPVSGKANPRSAAASEFPGDHLRDGNRRRPGVNPKAAKNESSGDRRKEGFNARWKAKQSESFSAAVSGPVIGKRNRRNSDWFFESWQGLYEEEGELLAFVVNTQSFAGSHFATFPKKLVEPCILAGTSAHGACAVCGAPWERITFKPTMGKANYGGKFADLHHRGKNLQKSLKYARAQGGEHDNPWPQRETTGWQPTCKCNGKFEKQKVILPARLSAEEAGLWGADKNGAYDGQSTKGHPEGIQNSSEVKARILKNATTDREVERMVYIPNIPLEDHPVRPCIVLDPFGGSGTVGEVALDHARHAILVELNRNYLPLIEQRTHTTPGLGLT